ncbi:hypothetical protein PHYPSEUDO_011650 [Phytophthora pseudosyringae]|uniref:M96 mating-specific protein family n=1 Tax=Phytophthora pseudosyringae TaxID=221518 RepID=A0A8T1VD19_9STRA|nr:hypothetical protein PHYPSEUDO_011650 [Phytophthora pseudosyringae]
MTPLLAAPLSALEALENDFNLSEFLQELDELDQLQDAQLEFLNPKRCRDWDVDTEPERKKMKATPPLETPKTTPRKRRSTSWLRRKQELNALRCESEALETRVTFMRMEVDRRCAFQKSLPTSFEKQGMWKSVAAIARQECESAQNENARLKNDVQLYARASEMLQTQLLAAECRRKQLLESTLVIADAFRVGMTTSRVLCFDNDGVLDMLERRINSRCHELDLILNEARRRPAEGSITEQVRVCRDGGQDAAAVVEFRYARLLPFGEDATAKSIWQIIELGGVITKTNTRVARSTSDMVGLVSRHTVPLGDKASVSADVHTVIKRFTVGTGMVALIESHTEWSIRYPASELLRSTTEEGGWVVVYEHPLEPCGATQRASQLRTSLKLRPNESKADGKGKSLTSTMVDVVIPSFHDILSSHHQSIENFMLDTEGGAI